MEITLENYEQKRSELLELNSNLTGIFLRENEIKLDKILEELKAEYIKERGSELSYAFPVLTDKKIRESRLYKFCSLLPKGADLHVHDMALLPAHELIALLKKHPRYHINTDKKGYDLIRVKEGEAAPSGYMRFDKALESGALTEEEILHNWTVAGAGDSGLRVWDYFENLFDRHAALSADIEFAGIYYHRAFHYLCEKNIMHIEIHIMLTESIEESEEYLKEVRKAYYDTKKEYPYFTARIIGAGVKADSSNFELTKKCFLNTTYVQEILKDESDSENITNFVIGFDLVNEEDTSLPLHDFAPLLLKAKKRFPDMKFYIHGGESLDAGNDNLIDAYLLGVSRVGHGFNLYRYPDLHSRYVRSEICLEVCPISNEVLGYTADIRNHPATEYLRSGMAMALCSDDPAYMENETLTDDYFAAVLAWDLGIAELKQFSLNSIIYSGLSGKQQRSSLKALGRLWNEFADNTLKGLNGI